MANAAGGTSNYYQQHHQQQQMARGGGGGGAGAGSLSYPGQQQQQQQQPRYNNRNGPNQNYHHQSPPMDASQMPPASMYQTSPTGTPSYVVNRSQGAAPAAAGADPAMQSIINHKFFQPSAPPLAAQGPNACAYQYQPVSFPYHAYGQMPYNQPQAVPE